MATTSKTSKPKKVEHPLHPLQQYQNNQDIQSIKKILEEVQDDLIKLRETQLIHKEAIQFLLHHSKKFQNEIQKEKKSAEEIPES